MNLNLRPKEECMFDEVSLGEIMLRLDPCLLYTSPSPRDS